MKTEADRERIARRLGAKGRGTIKVEPGYFGALGLVAEVSQRFQVPSRGGRATDPSWTERRLVPFNQETLGWLEALAQRVTEEGGVSIEPMQLAGILLEAASARTDAIDAQALVARRRRRGVARG